MTAAGLILGLLALVLWFERSSEAAAVQTIIYSSLSARKAVTPKSTPRLEPTLDELPSKITRAGNVIVWHPAAVEADGSYDVIVHFHGVKPALEPALREADLRCVLIIINDGLVAESYRDGHGAPGTLESLLFALHSHVAEVFQRDDVHARRVAISAWSAGFGAVGPMLRREDDIQRVDAVLVSDGLHVSFADPRRRVIADAQLGSVVAFAKRAMTRDKLFAITYTQIQTPDFASTSETAQKLLELLQITPDVIWDAPAEGELVPTAVAEKGDFVLLGFTGNDKHAHAVQQWALGKTLWARLKARWSR